MKRVILVVLSGKLCAILVVLALATRPMKKKQNLLNTLTAIMYQHFRTSASYVVMAVVILHHFTGERKCWHYQSESVELMQLETNHYTHHMQKTAGYTQSSYPLGEDSYVHSYTFSSVRYTHVQFSGVQ